MLYVPFKDTLGLFQLFVTETQFKLAQANKEFIDSYDRGRIQSSGTSRPRALTNVIGASSLSLSALQTFLCWLYLQTGFSMELKA